MPELSVTTQEFFDSPEFDETHRTLNEAEMLARVNREELVKQLAERRARLGENEHEASYWVDYYLEMDSDAFSDVFRGSEGALYYHAQREIARDQAETAREKLLEVAQQLGLGEFALYGLWAYSRGGIIPRADLVKKVEDTEEDLTALDSFVRSNTGKIMTYVGSLGVYSARLGHGGVSLNDQRYLEIPIVEGAPAYAMSFFEKESDVFEESSIYLRPHDFRRGNVSYHNSWNIFLNTPSMTRGEDHLVVGDVTEGPLLIGNNLGADAVEFYLMRLDRIRTVSNLALKSSQQNT